MPNWKKVITSGSNAALNNITASRLTLESSGSTIFDVVGSQGQLFSITDSLSGSLFAVSDISGLPILEVFSDDTVKIGSFNNEAIIVSGSNATITGSFTGSFTGDGSNLTNLPSSDPFPYTGSAVISGSLEVEGDITGSGKISLKNTANNTIIGQGAGVNISTGTNFTIIGQGAGTGLTTTRDSVAIGKGAMSSANSERAVAVGYNAGISSGERGVHIGHEAGRLNSGTYCVNLGASAGSTNVTTNSTVSIGNSANSNKGGTISNAVAIGVNSTSRNNTVTIGNSAGNNTSTDSVFLGYNAGNQETNSNRLYIENSNSTTPLIYGEFDNDLVRINGKLFVSNSLDITGSAIVNGDITTNTLSNISTTLASDSATNVDTFATATYTGAIYDYILIDATVGARTGQFMVAQDNGNITFTDTSTKHLTDSPIPEITAQINGANVEVQVTNGDGYTFKSFTKKL